MKFPRLPFLSPPVRYFPLYSNFSPTKHTTLSHHFPHPQAVSHYQTSATLSHHSPIRRPFLTTRHLLPYYTLPHPQTFSHCQTPAALSYLSPNRRLFLTTSYLPPYPATPPSAGLFLLPDTWRLILPLPRPQIFLTTLRPQVFPTTLRPQVFLTTLRPQVFPTTLRPQVFPTTLRPQVFPTTLRPQVFPTTRYLPHKVPGGHWRQMAGWTYGKKREEWVIEFASQKQILRIVEQTKHQFCLRFYPVHPFFPLFSISPSPSADWPPGTLCGRYRPP